MSREFCEDIIKKVEQGVGRDTQGDLLREIEKTFKEKGDELDYRKLCLVFMQRSSEFAVEAMRLSWAIDRAVSLDKIKEKAKSFDLSEASEFIGKHEVSKIEQYYQDIRDGKKSPRFRDDIPTDLIVEMKQSGMTLDSIATETGLARSTVVNRLRRWKQYNGC